MIILVLVVAYIIFRIYQAYQKRKIISCVTSLSRGEWSERDLIYRLVKAGIPASTIFHDLYIPNEHGHTQIDVVVPTNVGIFVFEVKDYSGWIFGNANSTKWTQILAYGQEKHQFYNPIMQNEAHITALRNTTKQLQNIPIYSVIVFYGTCRLKDITNIPINCQVVYQESVSQYVKNVLEYASPAPYTDKWEVMRILKSGMDNVNNESIRNAHLLKVQRASNGKFNSTYSYSYFHFPRFLDIAEDDLDSKK
jgi:hypothetical protein